MTEIRECPICEGDGERLTGGYCHACLGHGEVEVN